MAPFTIQLGGVGNCHKCQISGENGFCVTTSTVGRMFTVLLRRVLQSDCTRLTNETSFMNNSSIVGTISSGAASFATRVLSTSPQECSENHRPDWNRAVSEAEKIVGYPTSFLSLRYLLSDEVANVAVHLRRLVGTNHPLLDTAKGLINKDRNNMHAWGLIVLLISKTAGHNSVEDTEKDNVTGVLHSQRVLAEVTEMIRTSHLLHKGLISLYPEEAEEIGRLNDMTFGNKLALLSGDYLMSVSGVQLAALRNAEIIMLMSCAARDQSISEFIGLRDKQNQPLPSFPGKKDALIDWTERNVLSSGNLLGLACKGALRLARHSRQLQEEGYDFGKHLALAWQAFLELEPFIEFGYESGSVLNLTSAPIMFHLERDPSLYEEIEKGIESIHNVNYSKVYELVSGGPGIELTKQLQKKHSQSALEVLKSFEDSDARTALSNIILAMGEIK